MNTSGFVFQRSYWDALRGLADDDRLQLYDALTSYAFTGGEPQDVPQMVATCFTLIRPTLDASMARHAAAVANGRKGGKARADRLEPPTPINHRARTAK